MFLTHKQLDEYNQNLTGEWQKMCQRRDEKIARLQEEIEQLKNPVPAERMQYMHCKAITLHDARRKTRRFLRRVYGPGWILQETEYEVGDPSYTRPLPQQPRPGLQLEADHPGAMIPFVIAYRVTRKTAKPKPEPVLPLDSSLVPGVWQEENLACAHCGVLSSPGALIIWCGRGFCSEPHRAQWAIKNRGYT